MAISQCTTENLSQKNLLWPNGQFNNGFIWTTMRVRLASIIKKKLLLLVENIKPDYTRARRFL